MNESTTKGDVLIKHMASCASDALVDYEIDWPAKVLTVSMRPQRGKTLFFSSSVLASLADYLAHKDRAGIEIRDVDQDNSFRPLRTPWRVVVVIGAVKYQARIIRQCSINHRETTVELEALEGV